jgi:hypothetical protein
MKHPDPFVVVLDEGQVIKTLQHKMGWVEENLSPGMMAGERQKTFECDSVMKVFARMQFVSKVHTEFIGHVEQGSPPPGQFLKAGIDQTFGPLWPGVEIRPE